jgi:hypothetical protein
MERRIPVPLTTEDLRRDPDLIFALHAHARRERARLVGTLVYAAITRISAALRRMARRRPQAGRWVPAALVTR